MAPDARVQDPRELARGSFPITRRTSWPSSSSAAACSSACSTTAPQNDHENGTTIPIFTSGSLTTDGYAAHDGVERRRGCEAAAFRDRATGKPALADLRSRQGTMRTNGDAAA